jgi:hypothetical protein
MKKAFARRGLLLLLLVVLFLSSCQPDPQPTPEPPHVAENLVAVFVDSTTRQYLSTEIDRYVEDIQRELGLKVRLFPQDYHSPEQVREELICLDQTDILKGVILIGEVPIPWIEITIPNLMNVQEFPSDMFYMDLEEGSWTDTDSNRKYEWENLRYRESPPKKLIWSGRIKGYNGDLELLKAYFDRNHLYRTVQISLPRSLFVYSPGQHWGPSSDKLENYINNLKDCFTRDHHLYAKSQISILVDAQKRNFLSELEKVYETVTVHCHGWHTSQSLDPEGIDPERIVYSSDIKEVRPQGYFYHLICCGNGDFSRNEYIAGHYLLDGNGLLCVAYSTTAIMKSFNNSYELFPLLERGLRYGEALVEFLRIPLVTNDTNETSYPNWDFCTHLIGDPTLKFR